MSCDLRDHPQSGDDEVYCPGCDGQGRVDLGEVSPGDQELTNVYGSECEHCGGEGVLLAHEASRLFNLSFHELTPYYTRRAIVDSPANQALRHHLRERIDQHRLLTTFRAVRGG